MSARTDFKNALQKLTTTLVKAAAAKEHDDEAAIAALRATSVEQWKRVRTSQAALVAEMGAEAKLPHQGWFDESVARAEKLFGKLPGDE
jgi:hypothetical protein